MPISPEKRQKTVRRKAKVVDKRISVVRNVASHPRGLGWFGTSFVAHFLEVCAGTATLSQAVRLAGKTVMTPVDLSTGWDLTLPGHVPVSYTHLTLPTICSV